MTLKVAKPPYEVKLSLLYSQELHLLDFLKNYKGDCTYQNQSLAAKLHYYAEKHYKATRFPVLQFYHFALNWNAR